VVAFQNIEDMETTQEIQQPQAAEIPVPERIIMDSFPASVKRDLTARLQRKNLPVDQSNAESLKIILAAEKTYLAKKQRSRDTSNMARLALKAVKSVKIKESSEESQAAPLIATSRVLTPHRDELQSASESEDEEEPCVNDDVVIIKDDPAVRLVAGIDVMDKLAASLHETEISNDRPDNIEHSKPAPRDPDACDTRGMHDVQPPPAAALYAVQQKKCASSLSKLLVV
jgi:hypothetical protein